MLFSYSSLSCLSSCSRKFHYKYVAKLPPDKTYVVPKYFTFGSCFHKCLELTQHTTNNQYELVVDNAIEDFNLTEIDAAKLRKIFITYKKWFAEQNYKLLAVEKSFESQFFKGVIDAIVEDIDGYWYILEIKTPANFDEIKNLLLPLDIQLNIYDICFEDIAKLLDISPDKYKGVLYIEVKKPKQRLSKKETILDYHMRCSSDIKVTLLKKEDFKYDAVAFDIGVLSGVANQIIVNNQAVFPNRNSCIENGFACQYFEKCNGVSYERFCGVVESDDN